MANNDSFPHLAWTHSGSFTPNFGRSNRQPSDEALKAKAFPKLHSQTVSSQLTSLRINSKETLQKRKEQGLPDIAGKGFVIKVPEGTDTETLTHALGIELVAETPNGYMFAASDDLDLMKFEDVLNKFASNITGGGTAASIIEVFDSNDDDRKLDELLVGQARDLWPFEQSKSYTFDIGLQTAASTKRIDWTRKPTKKKGQTEEQRQSIHDNTLSSDRVKADEVWDAAAEKRYDELSNFISHYGGQPLTYYSNDNFSETASGICLPDSIQIRIRMSGQGFQDLVCNFPNIFELSFPPEAESLFLGDVGNFTGDDNLEVIAPSNSSPKVCVIDSGIQEEHRWLAPAIDSDTSICFLPDHDPSDIADQVGPRGHGTRVAGAVLYSHNIPTDGTFVSPFWLQNARVLDSQNKLPLELSPNEYLARTVDHFSKNSGTKIFNHSITDRKGCKNIRMSAWAAQLDNLSHRHDVLFIQSAGNINPLDAVGDSKFNHPYQLLHEQCKIADPAQSMHSVTVGSITRHVINKEFEHSFATEEQHPSPFSRSGFSPLWDIIKPELVEYGGDYLHSKPFDGIIRTSPETAPELLASTMEGQPAISCDDVGTSFSAPKVAHIAAHIQSLFPDASPQLYRALLVQSARWPDWAENSDPNLVLRTIGYGVPSIERATSNDDYRVTMLTEDAVEIKNKQYHLYQVPIPEEIRLASLENRIRIDVTLAYTATPRRTRSSRTGYLETWLEWRSNSYGESKEMFKDRMESGGSQTTTGLPWFIHQQKNHGKVEGTRRDIGSVQKDWAVIEANELPEDFTIAVRAHNGWNHKEHSSTAKYCLAVSFEAIDKDLPVYSHVEAQLESQAEIESEIKM